MSLITHGLVGHYTNETYPLPECGFFDWTVSGNSLEFGDFQSRVCISNKVIIGFTVSNVLTVGLTWAFGIYLTIHEFRLVREWNDTKNFLIFFYVGLIGAALFSVNDILGNPVWNSLGWYFATIGICAMEAFTVMVWARITLKISNVKRNIGADAAQTQLLRPLGQLMSGLTIFVCVGLLPVFALRAAWYKFEDPWWYNILMWAYHIIMLPWFPMFAYTVVTFATKLTNLLYETMGAFDELPGTTSGNGVLGTASYGQGSNSAADTTFGKLKAQSRKAKLMSVIKKIRFVAILVCLDKLGFLVSYTTFAIYGGLTMYEPKRGMAAYFSFSAMNGLIVFWGCGLLAGCAYYHLRVDNSPKNKSDRNSSSGSTDVQPQFDMGLNSFQPMNVFSQTPVSGLTAFSQDPRALKQLEAFTPPRPTQAEMAAGNYDLYGGPQKNSVYRRPSQSEAQPNYFGGLTTPSSINSGTTAVQGQQYRTSNDQMQQLQMQNGAWIQQHLALQQQQMLQQQQFTQQQQFSQQQHKPQGGYPYQY